MSSFTSMNFGGGAAGFSNVIYKLFRRITVIVPYSNTLCDIMATAN